MTAIKSWLSTKAIVFIVVLTLVFSMAAGASSAFALTSTGPIHTVTFSAVGAGQYSNEYSYLNDAQFNLYKYSGPSAISPSEDTISTLELASTTSTQWSPIIEADGTLGEAGTDTNEPYKFGVSSTGEVSLPMETNVYYMLVEVASADGYQVPQGQWAIKAIASGSGYVIDTSSILTHVGSDNSQPPDFATTLNVGGTETTGVFLVNSSSSSPLAVVGTVFLVVLILAALVLAFRIIRRRLNDSDGSASNSTTSNYTTNKAKPWWTEVGND